MNDLVIRCVLQYVKFEEIKNARFVSKIWSSIGLNALKTRSKIKFSAKKDIRPINFFSMFPIETQENAPFTDFSFSCSSASDCNPFDVEELNYFFKTQQKHIRELDFAKMHLVNKNCQQNFSKYDISLWLLNSAMTKPNTKYITKFEISPHYRSEGSTLIFVQLSALVNIKELRLSNCGVEIQEGIVINPTKMQIKDVFFHKNGNQLTQICVNDIINFSNAKEVDLEYNKYYSGENATEMILEMNTSADIDLQSLRLYNIQMNNIGYCSWNINHLHLNDMTLPEMSDMQIKELTCHSEVDISVLPQSIEKLTVYLRTFKDYKNSQSKVLNNLKALKLTFQDHGQLFRNFNFPFLFELHLENRFDWYCSLELARVPRTLRILKLRNMKIDDEEMNGTLNLDKLVMNGYFHFDVEKICGPHIQTTNLVLSLLRHRGTPVSNADDFLKFLRNQTICRGSDQRIYAGPFTWTKNPQEEFEESLIRGYADRASEYYLFENKVGKAIEREEFQIAMDCNFS